MSILFRGFYGYIYAENMVLFYLVGNSAARIVVPAKQSTASEAKPSAEDERQRRVQGPTRSEVKRSEGERPEFYF